MSVGGAGKSGRADSSARAAATTAKATETPAKTSVEIRKTENAKKTHGLGEIFKDVFSPASKPPPTGLKPRVDWEKNETGLHAGVAAIKGREPKTGIEMELFSAGVQVGRQNEAQVTMARVGVSSDDGAQSLRGDIFTGRVSGGTQNPDGSVGANFNISAAVVGAEATVGYSGNSATLGVAAGLGLEVSSGWRDADGDGRTEECVRAGIKLVTVGLCLESPVD